MAKIEASIDTLPSGIALRDGVLLDLSRLSEMWLIGQANNDGGNTSKASAQCALALE